MARRGLSTTLTRYNCYVYREEIERSFDKASFFHLSIGSVSFNLFWCSVRRSLLTRSSWRVYALTRQMSGPLHIKTGSPVLRILRWFRSLRRRNIVHVEQIYVIEILTCWEMLRRICMVQIQPRKHVLDHAGYTASTRRHDELDHADQASISPQMSTS